MKRSLRTVWLTAAILFVLAKVCFGQKTRDLLYRGEPVNISTELADPSKVSIEYCIDAPELPNSQTLVRLKEMRQSKCRVDLGRAEGLFESQVTLKSQESFLQASRARESATANKLLQSPEYKAKSKKVFKALADRKRNDAQERQFFERKQRAAQLYEREHRANPKKHPSA